MVQSPEGGLDIVFFQTPNGREPVRVWLRALAKEDRQRIGHDLKTVQYGWPVGMPLVRNLGDGVWEARSRLRNGIARVCFCVDDGEIILLHGFVKKSQRADKEVELAKSRAARYTGGKNL